MTAVEMCPSLNEVDDFESKLKEGRRVGHFKFACEVALVELEMSIDIGFRFLSDRSKIIGNRLEEYGFGSPAFQFGFLDVIPMVRRWDATRRHVKSMQRVGIEATAWANCAEFQKSRVVGNMISIRDITVLRGRPQVGIRNWESDTCKRKDTMGISGLRVSM